MKKYSLEGINGNAYSILVAVVQAMKQEGKSKAEINKYINDAKSGNYDNLLVVSLDIIDSLNSKYEIDEESCDEDDF